jgi:hypothetical protein
MGDYPQVIGLDCFDPRRRYHVARAVSRRHPGVQRGQGSLLRLGRNLCAGCHPALLVAQADREPAQ